MRKIKVLMTGAGAPGGPGIIKALQKDLMIELVVADVNSEASGRFLNKKFIQIPNANSPNFISFLQEVCVREKIEIIFPLVTKELFELAYNKKRFDELGIKVIVSDFDYLSIANDKSKLYSHLFKHGIDLPEFRVVKDIDSFIKAVYDLGYPNKPVCIKPSVSNGSRGVRILDNGKDEFDLLFNFKPNNLFSSLEKMVEILKEREFPELLISEYLPGNEFTIDTIVKNGQLKLILPRVRTKMNGGISVQGTFEKNDQIIAYCSEIINSMNLHGPIGIQVKADVNGMYKIIEINPRIQGTSVAALGLNINLPLIAVKQEIMEVNYPKMCEINWGLSFVRYYNEVFF